MSRLKSPADVATPAPDVLDDEYPWLEDEGLDCDRYGKGDIIGGKYRLDRVLGRGGMGSVWLASNITLDVDVAIKLIRGDAASEVARKRLLQEARAAAKLGHRSIVRVHDFGQTDQGDPFIVMELLRGESLGDTLVRGGRLGAVEAVRLMLPILGALSAAHAQGIVHRDLKPGNIILSDDGHGRQLVKLVDFGIAKLRTAESVADLPEGEIPDTSSERLAKHLTQVGALVGSPHYMSPEQARGDGDVDGRADVWGASVVLYEVIAGPRPFEAEEYGDLLIEILARDPVPITNLGAGDAALWEILKRGLTKARDKRFQSSQDLGEALASWLVQQGIETDISGMSLRQCWLGDGASSQPGVSQPGQPSAPSSRGFESERFGFDRSPPSDPSETGQLLALDEHRHGVRRLGRVVGGALVVSVLAVAGLLALAPWQRGVSELGAPAAAMAAALSQLREPVAELPPALPADDAAVDETSSEAKAKTRAGAAAKAKPGDVVKAAARASPVSEPALPSARKPARAEPVMRPSAAKPAKPSGLGALPMPDKADF